MKKMLVIWLALIGGIANSQYRQVSFGEIDERVKSIDAAPPAELAYTLTKDYHSESEKLRAIFSWITDHISYRVKKNYAAVRAGSHSLRAVPLDSGKWQSGNDFVAETVLQNKSAVCDGYARLFKTLCDYAGLRSAIITGFANGDYNRRYTFRCNHTWNAVYIDSTWRLLDVTWASGYTNFRGDEFVKRYDDNYFMTAPRDFVRDHFPDDLRWTLMEKSPAPGEFKSAPYLNKSFSKYKISSYFPAAGTIEAGIGDTIQISLETADPKQDSRMSVDTVPEFDQDLQKITATVALLEPMSASENARKLQYNFYVRDPGIEWLHIVYNHDTVLRYHLKIRKSSANTLALPIPDEPDSAAAKAQILTQQSTAPLAIWHSFSAD